MIAMLGDSSDDHMVKSGVKWLHRRGLNVMAMSPPDFIMEGFLRDGKDGAEDDVLWDTCKYIRRMLKRLEEKPHDCKVESLLYEHGTHFVFPQSMLTTMLPVGSGLLIRLMFRAGRQYPRECEKTRMDIDERLSKIIREW